MKLKQDNLLMTSVKVQTSRSSMVTYDEVYDVNLAESDVDHE